MNPGPITVLIVDDHPIVRSGLRALLDSAPGITVAGEADNGDTAVRYAAELCPQVIIMDLHMPLLDGVSATRAILRRDPTVAVIALTMLEDDESVRAALIAGARGYLLKGAEPGAVVRGIRSVAAGEAVLGPCVARHLGQLIQRDPSTANRTFHGLTDRELQVLELLAGGASNQSIGHKLGITAKTVRNHVSNVFTKLGAANRLQAVLIARNAGIGVPDPPSSQAEGR